MTGPGRSTDYVLSVVGAALLLCGIGWLSAVLIVV